MIYKDFEKTENRPTIYRWLQLVLCFALIGTFVFVLAPLGQLFEPVKTLHEYIEERGIDATPLYYTESEEFSVAQLHMDSTNRFCPYRFRRK